MTAPAWPDDMGFAIADGFTDTFPDLVARAEVDAGPARQRRKTTAAPWRVTVSYVMTSAERSDLEEFYHGPAAGGGVWFDWKHPVTLATVPARFVQGQPPAYRPYKPDWLVDVALEVLR